MYRHNNSLLLTIYYKKKIMNHEQLKLLNKMKKLIKEGKKKFSNRSDRNYVDELFQIGITEEEAWNKYILYLSQYDYIFDYKPSYRKSGNSLTFKKKINNIIVYIKLKIEYDNDEECTVCLSFHRDEWV